MCSNIETYLAVTERTFNSAAAYPVLGIITGCFKTVIGVIQLVISIALAIFRCCCGCMLSADNELCTYAFKHTIHGLANMFSGVILAIPLVGTLLVCFVGKRIIPYYDQG